MTEHDSMHAPKSAHQKDCPEGHSPLKTALDEKTLRSLRMLQRPGKPNVLGKIFSVFLLDSERAVSGLVESFREDDREELLARAHSLKSSSGGVGALALSEVCRQVEQLLRVDPDADVSTLIEQVEAEYSRVREAIVQELQQPA